VTSSLWDKSYTPVEFPSSRLKLKPERPFYLWGSCFAQELSNYLKKRLLREKFSFLGISYNPLSLAEGLLLLADESLFHKEELFFHQDQWKHPLFHGMRNQADKAGYVEGIKKDITEARSYLKECPLMVLTLGSAWVYRGKENGRLVNNCHRQEASLFTRELLEIGEMEEALGRAMDTLARDYPGLEWVLTVSPVRHLRDAAPQNSLSKARLICTAQELALKRADCHYFPSWEIMMDELRDYRWYDRNMKNPSPEAVEYIMGRFMEWSGSEELQKWLPRAEALKKRMDHRFFGKNPEAEERFRKDTRKQWDSLKQSYSHLEALCFEEYQS